MEVLSLGIQFAALDFTYLEKKIQKQQLSFRWKAFIFYSTPFLGLSLNNSYSIGIDERPWSTKEVKDYITN